MLLQTNPTCRERRAAPPPLLRVGRYVRFESWRHAGLQVAGDREPKEIREQFKAWCTRRLKVLQQERLRRTLRTGLLGRGDSPEMVG